MAHCPVCNAPIHDDFGLIECPKCSAQLIVHMDGRVEHAGAQISSPEPSEDFEHPAPDSHAPEEAPVEENFSFGEAEPEFEIPAETPEAPVEEQAPVEFGAATEAGHGLGEHFPDPNTELANISAMPAPDLEPPPQEPPPLEEPPAETPAADPLDLFAEEQAPPAAEVYAAPTAPTASDSPDLSDIARFGNSDISVRDGSLRYNVFITGIDTADVREAFREAITDRKLVWDIDQILRSLKNGEVQIQNVTPPKAHILISRLRNIPVQVRWEQYAISQA